MPRRNPKDIIKERVREHDQEIADAIAGDEQLRAKLKDTPLGVLFAQNAAEIVQDADGDGLPDAPPAEANYRPADLEGIACWNCSHFEATGDNDAGWPSGICHLWEAQAQGQNVCDKFTADPTLFDGPPHDGAGQMGFSEDGVRNEIFLADGKMDTEDDKYVVKTILRTGHWDFTPGMNGLQKKPLTIRRDGASDPEANIISLSELVDNFNERVVPYVTIPLSQDAKDHPKGSALTRYNTGFVRDLWIEDGEEDTALLQAKLEFTEPDVDEKVRRGTIPDVSCGIPYNVLRKTDGKIFNSVLEHVVLTARPFVDGMTPFGIAASNENSPELASYVEHSEEAEEAPAEEAEEEKQWEFSGSHQELMSLLNDQLRVQLSAAYEVTDFKDGEATVYNDVAEMSWTAPFEIKEGENSEAGISFSDVETWEPVEEKADEPPAKTRVPSTPSTPLEEAQSLRELRLSQPTGNDSGGSAMPRGIEALDGLELSDEARKAVEGVLAANSEETATLNAKLRERDVDKRIGELEELGLKERPGALKLYRQVFLSDDGGPAIVLLSDDGSTEKEKLTAKEVLDRFIEAIKGSDEKVTLSDQALVSGNDDPPPADAEHEKKPLEERVADAREAIGVSGPSDEK